MKRNSIQRNLVLEAACLLNHPTADAVYHEITRQHPSISRGTVYRNLNLLVDHGLLRRVEVPGGAVHFDKTIRRHFHVYCRNCGAVDDAKLPYIPNLMEESYDTHGFAVEDYDIILRGVCPVCQAAAIDSTA